MYGGTHAVNHEGVSAGKSHCAINHHRTRRSNKPTKQRKGKERERRKTGQNILSPTRTKIPPTPRRTSLDFPYPEEEGVIGVRILRSYLKERGVIGWSVSPRLVHLEVPQLSNQARRVVVLVGESYHHRACSWGVNGGGGISTAELGTDKLGIIIYRQ